MTRFGYVPTVHDCEQRLHREMPLERWARMGFSDWCQDASFPDHPFTNGVISHARVSHSVGFYMYENMFVQFLHEEKGIDVTFLLGWWSYALARRATRPPPRFPTELYQPVVTVGPK